MSRDMSAPIGSIPPQRPFGLSILLVFLGTGTLTSFMVLVSGRVEMIATVELAPPWLRGGYVVLHALNLIALVGLWRWRRWAVWLAMAFAPISMLTESLIGMPFIHVVRIPIVLTVLLLLVGRHRHRFG